MKNLNNQSRLATLLLIMLGCCIPASAQIKPSGDAYTNTATPTTTLGAKPLRCRSPLSLALQARR
jgi:hypothetical protein